MTKNVLVTGGAGYIGSHACKALAAAGYTPICFDNLSTGNDWAIRWGPLEQGDILDLPRVMEVFAKHRPVGVVHFAALSLVGESVRDPARYWRVNTGGALNILDACRSFDVGAFVFSSTCAIYGQPEKLPIDEDTPAAPLNAYGASKRAVEQILEDYDRAYGLKSCALRYFNAAGADPDGEIGECRAVETHLVPLALDAIAGRRPALKVFGTDYPTDDGTAIRDYIHVMDLAEAHVSALDYLLDGGESQKLNLGTGTGYSVHEVLSEAGRQAGTDVPHSLADRREGDAAQLVADPQRAHRLFGNALTQRSDLKTIMQTAWSWQCSQRYTATAERFKSGA